jgi:formylglycine-generating enzyme required for sulfatase activity
MTNPKGKSPRTDDTSLSRKERYQREEETFTFSEKAAYFAKIGIPIVGGVVVVILFIVFLTESFRGSVRPDEAKDSAVDQARDALKEAVAAERRGEDIAAVERLQYILRRFPGTESALIAQEALERRENGERMFPRGLPDRSDASRALEAAGSPPVAGGADERRSPDEAKSGPAKRGRSDRTAVVVSGSSGAAQPDPEQLRQQAIQSALAIKPELELGTNVPAKKLPAGFAAKPNTALHISGWPISIVCAKDDSEMVFVPPGSFSMGRNDGAPNEQPAREVALGGFYIDRFEIRWEQYQRFQAANPLHPTISAEARAVMTTGQHPVVGVTFADCVAYCAWAGKRLPTEAQWERAARGPSSSYFPWGDDPGMAPQGRKPGVIEPTPGHAIDRSAFGVFDLAGNAAEWCSDWYVEDAHRRTGSVEPKVVGEPPTPARERAIRGRAPDGSVSWRDKRSETQPAPWLGFRGVLVVETEKVPAPLVKGTRPTSESRSGSTSDRSGGRAAIPADRSARTGRSGGAATTTTGSDADRSSDRTGKRTSGANRTERDAKDKLADREKDRDSPRRKTE